MRSSRLSAKNCLWLALILSLLLVTTASAETFVSYNGKFNITYPDTWEQIDYQTADFYIRQATGDLAYEAVFATKDSPAVFEGTYVILTVDTSGALDQSRIDSAIGVIVESFGRNLAELPLASFATDLSEAVVAPRKNILVQKFYDRGIANFYFYVPDSLLSEGLGSLSEILASFSTETTRTDTTPVKVADLESRQSSDSTNYVVMYGGLIVILLCLVLVRIRQRRRK